MQIGQQEFDFDRQVCLMGILNVTPDSFSDGGLYLDPERALDRTLQMEGEGADLIDVGAESSRPGSQPVSPEEELKRLLPVLKKIIPRLKVPVSVDTRKGIVAQTVLREGAAMINDVSALRDPGMAAVIAEAEVPVILMHMKGEPETMQANPHYDDPVGQILRFLKERIDRAAASGVPRDKILVDPGIGFGKRFEDNEEILERLSTFKSLECPIVIGASRKSFVRRKFGEKPKQILEGSVATALLAAERGASLLRVHDVRETRAAIRLANPPFFR